MKDIIARMSDLFIGSANVGDDVGTSLVTNRLFPTRHSRRVGTVSKVVAGDGRDVHVTLTPKWIDKLATMPAAEWPPWVLGIVSEKRCGDCRWRHECSTDSRQRACGCFSNLEVVSKAVAVEEGPLFNLAPEAQPEEEPPPVPLSEILRDLRLPGRIEWMRGTSIDVAHGSIYDRNGLQLCGLTIRQEPHGEWKVNGVHGGTLSDAWRNYRDGLREARQQCLNLIDATGGESED